jgi:hypothetical protein
MITTGMSKKFFLYNKYIISLTTAGYFISADRVVNIPHIDGADGLWSRISNKSGKTTAKTFVKIPVGHIGLASTHSGRKRYIGQSDLKAWIRSMTPCLNAHIFGLPNTATTSEKININNTIRNRTSKLYIDLLPMFEIKEAPAGTFIHLPSKRDLSSRSKKELIDTIREFQTLSFMHINRLDDYLINNLNDFSSAGFRDTWRNNKWGIVKDTYAWKFDLILSIMFRAIFTPGDPYTKLTKIKRFLPINESNLTNMCDRIYLIKKEGTTSSAALARVFEEKLLRQKKHK